ncbi:MAG: Hsp33 family molecular chaperone HslO [Clostridiaceae bacterium]|nr:Hsp33 family molecular chaperone HslO [Clostridiaceae bacterium]
MADTIERAITKDGAIRVFAASTTGLVEEARKIHDLFPTAAAALGRVLTAGAMMGAMLKGEKDTVTIQFDGGGPIGKVLAVANSKAEVKGYVGNPHVDLPLNKNNKLDVGGAVGTGGYLSIIRDFGLKEPYIGRVKIQSGEIAEDLTYYFARSEQIPSAVSLGVLVDRDYSIKAAGGFIIQMMPEATEAHISAIEKVISEIPSISHMISEGYTPKMIIEKLLSEFEIEYLSQMECKYHCDCTVERIERALVSLGKEELEKIINEDKSAEVVCHFCNKKYQFGEDELKALLDRAIR